MNKLKLGVVGLGSVVREIYEHLYFRSRYSPMIDVAAICDTDPAALAQFGDTHAIPMERRFRTHRQMLAAAASLQLEAVAVNTPDNFHREPVIDALKAGFDVLLPKPLTGTVEDADAIIREVERTGRFLGVDYHKRENPVIREARSRVAAGRYGTLQTAVLYMLDRLVVADPNRTPRFFASPDFAAKNSPVSFLMSHVADTFIFLTGLKPFSVRATGYRQKLPSLTPIAVDGYDTVDAEVRFHGGATAHFIVGWALPDAAPALTTQSARFIFTDGLLDLAMDRPGIEESTAGGFDRPHVLFRTFRDDGVVTGFGMDSPGEALEAIARYRAGGMDDPEYRARTTAAQLGFYATVICDCAERSLAAAAGRVERAGWDGVVAGGEVIVDEVLTQALGAERAARY